MALAYGLGHVVRQTRAVRTLAGSSYAAAAVGVPAIVTESGQNGLLEAAAVYQHITGLTNVLRHLGVLAGTPVPGEELAR